LLRGLAEEGTGEAQNVFEGEDEGCSGEGLEESSA
jgi:hypothetical protein